jgi:hypothetical protein
MGIQWIYPQIPPHWRVRRTEHLRETLYIFPNLFIEIKILVKKNTLQQPLQLDIQIGYAPSRASDGPDGPGGPGPDLPTDPRSEASASYPFAPIPHPWLPRPFPPLAASSPHSFPLPRLAVAIAVALVVALRYRSRCCSLGQTLGSHPYRCRRSCSHSLPPSFCFASSMTPETRRWRRVPAR